MRQDHARHHLSDLRGLRHRLFEELETHGRVEKQVTRDDRRALRAGGFRNASDDAALVDRARARVLPHIPGSQRQPRHRRDGGQRLAAEAQGVQVEQIIGFAWGDDE